MALSGKIAAQVAKLLRKEVTKQFETPLPKPAVMRHGPLPDISPEREGDVFATPFLPEEQAPRTEMAEGPVVLSQEAAPQRSALRQQVENLGGGEESEIVTTGWPDPEDFAYKLPFYNDKNEAIKDATQMTEIAKKWEPQYKKAQAQGFTIPLYHWSKAGEEIITDPRGEGTGFLDPLILTKSIRDKKGDTGDIGVHVGIPTTMSKIDKGIPMGQSTFPVVTKLNKVAIVPDMTMFKIPSRWIERLSSLDVRQNPTTFVKGVLRKNNLREDFKKNKDILESTLDETPIDTVADLKKYADENGPFIFWPEDGNFVYLKNKELQETAERAREFSSEWKERFDPLKNMSPTLWKQLMEAAHKFHLKNLQATREQVKKLKKPTTKQKEEVTMFIPENIHPSVIQDWYEALNKILEDNGYDAFAYPNYTEDRGAFSYMFLDPKKVKSIFAKEFDPESFSFGKKAGGVVDMRNGGKVGMKVGGKAAAYDLSELEKAVDIDTEGVTEAARFVQDYGKHRVGRMSQTDTGYPPLPQRKEVIGKFYEGTKDIYTKPYEIDELGRPVPFDKKAAIQIEQHEAGHSFLDAARAISMNEKVLKTLPVKEQKRLFKFLDFWEKQVTPEGKKFVYFTQEHDIMGTGPSADMKKKFLYPSDPRKADITEPKSIWTEDKPLAVLPDDPVGKGIGRSSTINKIAKSLNKAYAKYPEVYNEFFKKWRKEGINLPTYAGTYSKKLEALTSKDNQSGFSKEMEKLQGIGKNKGGKVIDMRNGGRVRMQVGGRLPDILMKMAIEEQEEQARQAGQELSETEKAIDVTREGTIEPTKYMYDYGKRRQKRLSQVPSEHQFDERYSGSFSRRPGKKINVAPRMDVKTKSGESFKGWEHRMGWGPQAEKEERRGFRDRLPFIGETRYPEKGAAIGTEQHEFIHAFLNFIKIATINRDTDKRYDEVLSTLSREDQIKLYKFLDFTQRQENLGGVSGPKAMWKRNRIEHELMDLDKNIQLTLKPGTGYERQRFRTPGSPETLPEVYISQEPDFPKGDTTYMHEGIGRSGTISQLAKAFNEAAAQNPEIHSRAKEKWVTSDTPSPDILFNFDNVVKQLQGEEFYESSARNTEQQQQLQQQQESFNQNKGGRIK